MESILKDFYQKKIVKKYNIKSINNRKKIAKFLTKHILISGDKTRQKF